MTVQGTVHKYGDNVDTDVIIPARYLNTSSHEELAAHCMEDIDRDFVNKVKTGDILVAEKNFGCGSSREHAPSPSRPAASPALSPPPSPGSFTATPSISAWPSWNVRRRPGKSGPGDEVRVDFDTGVIENRTTGKTYRPSPSRPLSRISSKRRPPQCHPGPAVTIRGRAGERKR